MAAHGNNAVALCIPHLGRAIAATVRAARDVCPTRLPADAAAPNLSGSGSAKSPLLRRSRPATARLASGGQETRLHQQVIAQCEEFDTCHLSSTPVDKVPVSSLAGTFAVPSFSPVAYAADTAAVRGCSGRPTSPAPLRERRGHQPARRRSRRPYPGCSATRASSPGSRRSRPRVTRRSLAHGPGG